MEQFKKAQQNIVWQRKLAKHKWITAVIQTVVALASIVLAYLVCTALYDTLYLRFEFISNPKWWLASTAIGGAMICLGGGIAFVSYTGFTKARETAEKLWGLFNRKQLETNFLLLLPTGSLSADDIRFVRSTVKGTTVLLVQYPFPAYQAIHNEVVKYLNK